MEYKKSRIDDPYLFYKPKPRITGLRASAMNFVLRIGAVAACPGDDIAMVAASSSNALDSHSENPAALLYKRPEVSGPILIYKGNIN